MKVTKGRGYVYSLCYHIVFCVKYRRTVLAGPIETRLKVLFRKQAVMLGFEILSMEVMSDHVHLLHECTPQHTIPELVRRLKGTTARFLFREFPELRKALWGGHLWSPSYFVSSVGEQVEETIIAYIDAQKRCSV